MHAITGAWWNSWKLLFEGLKLAMPFSNGNWCSIWIAICFTSDFACFLKHNVSVHWLLTFQCLFSCKVLWLFVVTSLLFQTRLEVHCLFNYLFLAGLVHDWIFTHFCWFWWGKLLSFSPFKPFCLFREASQLFLKLPLCCGFLWLIDFSKFSWWIWISLFTYHL